jgi:serine/threonine protein kinase
VRALDHWLRLRPNFLDPRYDWLVSLRVLLVLQQNLLLSVLNIALDAFVSLTSPEVLCISSISKVPATVLSPPIRLTRGNVRSFNLLHNHRMTSLYIPPAYNIEFQHNGTEHLAINNKFFRRFLTRLALHTTAKFYSRDGLCIPISKHKIVKTGRRIHLTEGATMKYLSEKTAIPIPQVYCSFLHKNRAYIVMERIEGEELPKAWRSMSEESIEGVFAQLRGIFQELRSLTPPSDTGVESCVGGSLYDSRIPRGNPRFGAFKKIQDFHFWLRRDLKLEDLKDPEKDQDWHDLQEMINR